MVSIVIPSRNEPRDLLEATIDGIHRTCSGHRYEVLLIDDASDLPVSLNRPNTTVLRNPEVIGVSRSLRRGSELARGDVFLALDAHMTFFDDWLTQMLARLEDDMLLCPMAMSYDLTQSLYWGANCVWEEHKFPKLHYSMRVRRPRSALANIPMLMGACYMLTRVTSDRLGGFNPILKSWGLLEQDLSLRARIAGMRVCCATKAGVGHYYRLNSPAGLTGPPVVFNMLVVMQTVFERPLADLLTKCAEPVSDYATQLVEDEAEAIGAWRDRVQALRTVSDAELFAGPMRALAASVPVIVGKTVRFRPGRQPIGVIRRQTMGEELALCKQLPAPAFEMPAMQRGSAKDEDREAPSAEGWRVHAGVVGWQGQALVLVGGDAGGVTAVVAELLRAGADLYAQNEARFDSAGNALPTQSTLTLRNGDVSCGAWTAEALGGRVGRDAIPVRTIALIRYEEGRRWRIEETTRGKAMLAFLETTILPNADRDGALACLRRVASAARVISVLRGPAHHAARRLLPHMDTRNQTGSA